MNKVKMPNYICELLDQIKVSEPEISNEEIIQATLDNEWDDSRIHYWTKLKGVELLKQALENGYKPEEICPIEQLKINQLENLDKLNWSWGGHSMMANAYLEGMYDAIDAIKKKYKIEIDIDTNKWE